MNWHPDEQEMPYPAFCEHPTNDSVEQKQHADESQKQIEGYARDGAYVVNKVLGKGHAKNEGKKQSGRHPEQTDSQ